MIKNKGVAILWRYRRLSDEEKNELIDRIAKKISEYDVEIPASIFLSGLRPISFIANQLGILFAGPFLELFGQDAYDILSLLENPGNTKKLMEKVEAIRKEKKNNLILGKNKINDKKSFLDRLKSYF